jgi:hypothetical protein
VLGNLRRFLDETRAIGVPVVVRIVIPPEVFSYDQGLPLLPPRA